MNSEYQICKLPGVTGLASHKRIRVPKKEFSLAKPAKKIMMTVLVLSFVMILRNQFSTLW